MLTVLIALALSALVAPGIIRWIGTKGFYVVALAPFGGLLWVLTHWPDSNRAPEVQTLQWVPSLHMNIVMRMDSLAAILSVLILGVGTLVLCYCAHYFDDARPRVAVFGGEMVAFAAAMFGLVTSDNMLVLYIFWELTTVLSFMLVGYYRIRATSRRSATQALLVTTLGGLAMLVGIIMLGERTGSYLLSDLLAHPPAAGVYVEVAVVLLLVGALSKSAIVPFHFWLPGAMAAPTPVSAYLHAAAMVKAGIYLIGRLAPAFAPLPSWQIMVIGLGSFTMLLGGWRSMRELDLKLVLAFGTVSQLGFMAVLMGMGDANVAMAGLAMLVAHALFKASLFMVVGIIDHATGTRDIRKLARLGHRLPVLAAIAAVAGASMAGLPFTLGFVGKETAFGTVWETGSLQPWQAETVDIVLLVGSVITFAYTCRFLWGAFGRKVRRLPTRAVAKMHPPSPMFLLSPLLLAALGVIAGFWSGWLGHWFEPYAESLPAYGHELEHLAMWHGFGLPVVFSVIVVLGGAVLFLVLRRLRDVVFGSRPLINADRIYDATLRGADTLSLLLTRNTQRGSLPVTQGVILSTMIILPTVMLFLGNRNTLEPNGFDSMTQAVIAVIMAAAALATVILRNRLAATLVVGVTGYGCGMLFALYGAPDLALTQFLVETLTLVIFVLVLRKLPAEPEPRHATGFKPLRAAIGLALGVSIVAIGMFAAAARSAQPVSISIPEVAYKFGHGANAVNVLLVDTRAWDTLGEVSVLIVAATGVASMVFRNRRFGAAPRVADAARHFGITTDDDDDPIPPDRTTWLLGSEFRDPRHRSMVLEATTRLIFPTMVVLSVYFFYAGHNSPGGGFAGGLTMGLALVLRYLAGGRYELGEALPVEPGTFLGAGLLISASTAVTSMFLGAPALSSAVFQITVPVLGDIKFVTALFFDLGIYLIVIGLVLDVLRSLGARLDVESGAGFPSGPLRRQDAGERPGGAGR
ncbi:putative monovalent cation/H+ antiporter subunit A [Gordonia polyisoprenivorans VH2]|uniref:Putative monovalent cation/H+ antiporter subunit A n=1 Tax=Gordonia polyisoprenivorans (strain DSM 44266 / VH2) TaxID=1112204 RepID=H6MYL4_GORPV|nr:Na+/H+ antiporter subunit A [Gordonia polyisoprenivorans]AFA71892.1 putative monovalent cation/H+ antiporter subunit A [Gordonia polyisoprenivorans VH2]